MLNQNIISGVLGKNTTIGKNSIADKYTYIGDKAFINTNCMIIKATIGNYCSIGSGIIIGQGEHKLDAISLSERFYKSAYDELTNKSCEISHDVWIGTGAVIGARTIVTKDIPDFAVVVGVPARILKYRFDKEKQNQIFESKWFEKDLDAAKIIVKSLS